MQAAARAAAAVEAATVAAAAQEVMKGQVTRRGEGAEAKAAYVADSNAAMGAARGRSRRWRWRRWRIAS